MTASYETKRPLGVILVQFIISITVAENGLRFGETIFFWKTMVDYGANPMYLSIISGIWLLLGIFLIWILWKRIKWGQTITICGTLGYTLWYWLDRLTLQKHHANWVFALIWNIIIVGMMVAILASKNSRDYFEKDFHGRQLENSTFTQP